MSGKNYDEARSLIDITKIMPSILPYNIYMIVICKLMARHFEEEIKRVI
jgi:hypothetical protein